LDNPFLVSPTPPTASVLFDSEGGPSFDFDEIWERLEGEALARRSRGWAIVDKDRVLEVLGSIEYSIERREGFTTAEGWSTRFDRMLVH